jgi:hypothetical protein
MADIDERSRLVNPLKGTGRKGHRNADELQANTIRYFTEGAFDPIAVFAGLVQTAIYADFGYIVCPTSSSSAFQAITLLKPFFRR